MTAIGEALLQAGSSVLSAPLQQQLDFEGELDEFGQRLCETMADFGATHLNCLGTHEQKILFLQQVSACMPGAVFERCTIWASMCARRLC